MFDFSRLLLLNAKLGRRLPLNSGAGEQQILTISAISTMVITFSQVKRNTFSLKRKMFWTVREKEQERMKERRKEGKKEGKKERKKEREREREREREGERDNQFKERIIVDKCYKHIPPNISLSSSPLYSTNAVCLSTQSKNTSYITRNGRTVKRQS
jgi:hypothetical protein